MVKRLLSRAWRIIPARVRRAAVRAVEPTFTVATGAVVLDDTGRVLLLEHVFRPGNPWGIPGGFIENGEQPEDAIRRELREEIALEVDALELAFVRTLAVTKQVEIVFVARAAGEASPRSVEIVSHAWYEAERLGAVLSRDQREIVERALASPRCPRVDR